MARLLPLFVVILVLLAALYATAQGKPEFALAIVIAAIAMRFIVSRGEYLAVSAAAFIFLPPFFVVQVGPLTVTPVKAVVAMGVALVAIQVSQARYMRPPPRVVFLGLIIMLAERLVSEFLNATEVDLFWVQEHLSMLFYAVIAGQMVRKREHAGLLAYVLLVSILLNYWFEATTGGGGTSLDSRQDVTRAEGLVGGSNGLGYLAAIAGLASIYAVIEKRKPALERVVGAASALMSVNLLWWSGSRTATIMFASGLTGLSLLTTRGMQRIGAIVAVLAVLAAGYVLAPESYTERVGSTIASNDHSTGRFSDRVEMLDITMDLFPEAPLLGHGYSAFTNEFNARYGSRTGMHLAYLDSLIQGGIVLAATHIAVVVLLLLRAAKACLRAGEDRNLVAWYFAMALGVAFGSAVGGTVTAAPNWVVYILCDAVAQAAESWREEVRAQVAPGGAPTEIGATSVPLSA